MKNTYHTDKYKEEIKACIVAPTYNNVAGNRYLWHLESILQQEYKNYKVIIIDDQSADQTSLKIARHLKWRGADKQKFILIKNKKHATALPNYYYAIHKYCDYNQIFYTLDGDDQIIGTQVFKLYNAIYQEKKIYAVYSNYYQYIQFLDLPVALGISTQYPQQIKMNNGYRLHDHDYSQLRTIMTDLFLLMNIQSLRNADGQIYKVVCDNAIYFSAMQMSCGRVSYIPEIEYWYNANTGGNDWLSVKKKTYFDTLVHMNSVQKHYQCLHKTLAQMEVSVTSAN